MFQLADWVKMLDSKKFFDLAVELRKQRYSPEGHERTVLGATPERMNHSPSSLWHFK